MGALRSLRRSVSASQLGFKLNHYGETNWKTYGPSVQSQLDNLPNDLLGHQPYRRHREFLDDLDISTEHYLTTVDIPITM